MTGYKRMEDKAALAAIEAKLKRVSGLPLMDRCNLYLLDATGYNFPDLDNRRTEPVVDDLGRRAESYLETL